jgi:tetratricopeptide (TPR) repeat protein
MKNLIKKLVINVFLLLMIFFIFNFASAMSYQEIKSAYTRSYLYEKTQDYKDAIKALMFVYKTYPEGYTINLRLGWLYYLSGKYANSEKQIARKMLYIYPTDVNFLNELAISLYHQKKFVYAESLFKDVLILNPENVTAKEYLKLLQKVGKNKHAKH